MSNSINPINREIKLGYCPYCGDSDYNRSLNSYEKSLSDGQTDYCSMDCSCSCGEYWTEYFSLDEVKFDRDGEEICYTNTLEEKYREILIKALNLLIDKEGDTKDYSSIIRTLKGGLSKE